VRDFEWLFLFLIVWVSLVYAPDIIRAIRCSRRGRGFDDDDEN